MVLEVKHTKQTALPDDPSKEISASEWNEAHTITGHNKAEHDALLIDADTVDTLHASSFATASHTHTDSIAVTIGDGQSLITIGEVVWVSIPYACTINSVVMLANEVGSIVVDIWKDTYANYPPTSADTICSGAKPTISGAIKSEDTSLVGWTTSVSAGDILKFSVESVSSIKKCVLILKITK